MSINRVVLTGGLTRDPELRSTTSGTSVLSMRMAFSDRRKNSSTGEWEDLPNYIDVTLFGARAEGLSRHLGKGSKIGVDGRLRWREWESSAGEKRSAVEVIADNIEFIGPRPENVSGESGGGKPSAPTDDVGGEEIPF